MAALFELLLSPQSWLVVLFCICIYLITVAVYRLYFGPLAKFPGPKLAALTRGVEFCHDVFRRGQYTFEILKMHEKYGPIVRIAPDELHINDPVFLDEIFPGSHKPIDKPQSHARAFGNSLSIISTVQHDLHKKRRNHLNHFFSKRAVNEYAGCIQSCVSKLCTRLEEFQASQTPVDLRVAYSALTVDLITLYCLGRSSGSLDKPDFDPQLGKAIASGGELRSILKRFPWIFSVVTFLHESIGVPLGRNAMDMINRRKAIEVDVQALMRRDRKKTQKAGHPPIVFQELMDSDLPDEEKSMTRLVDEGITLVGAGTVTTAHVLSTITYFVLANPEIFETLQRELREQQPDGPDLSAQTRLVRLEQLPYLTATIMEGLRLAHGVLHRGERVAPDRSLHFQDWTIPPGTVVSMSASFIHVNPTFFPSPQDFRPERWLLGDTEPTGPGSLKRYFMPFGKGSRMCLGINLAYAELYLTLEAVFRKFELQLFETTRDDVDIAHDFVVGTPRLDSKGMRVLIRKRGD